MADLAIIVDTKSLVDAKKKLTAFQSQMGKTNSILGLSRALNGVESNVKELVTAQKKGQLSSNSFKQGLLEQKKALVAMGLSFSQAKQKVDQLAAALKSQQAVKAAAKDARDLARAQKEVADAHERTRQRYVAGAAAQAQLKQAQRDLSAAYRAGVINIDEYRKALILLNQQNLGNRRSTNNLGVAMQQTGYQVGDFVVQVQSGQNPMVAFGQQATQLVGVLYLLPPATLAARVGIFGLSLSVSALIMSLGIIVPILTAVGAAYMRFKKESDKAGKAVSELEERVKSLKDSLKEYKREKLAESLGITGDQLLGQEAVDAAKLRLKEAEDNYRTYVNNLNQMNPFKAWRSVLTMVNPFSDPSDTSSQDKAVTDAKQDLIDANARLEEQQKKRFADQKFYLDQELALQQKIAKHGADSSKVKSLELEQEIASRHRDLEAQRKSLELKGYDVDALKAQVAEVLTLTAANENLGKQLLSHVELYQKALNKRKESIASFQEQLVAQSKVLALLEIEEQFTKDSYKYREELVAQEADRLNKLLDQKEITEQQYYIALALFKAFLDVNDAIAKGANSATNIADALKEAASAMSDFLNVGSLETKLAGLVAETNAIKTGADSAGASLVAVELLKARKNRDAALEGGDIPSGAVNKAYQDRVALINQVGEATASRNAARDAARKSGTSGGGSNVVNINEIIAARKEQIAQDRVLLGLSGEQQAAQKIYYGLLKQNEKADIQLTEVELKGAADAIAAYEEQNRVLEGAKQQQEEVAGVIADNFGSAFMSIVDGTKSAKEAFKDMARSIIKQLFQILVVEKMVKSIKSFISPSISAVQANGGAWQGGSQIQAYANGGVVGGPTTFPMSGGKTGLMGEAGPEAIMPLKRGANGKLGVQMEGNAGGDVIINQSFNFQANGDDSVKRIIQQQIPRITEATKAAVVDSKRRGGSFGRAF